MESPGTAPGSNPFITSAFISIVPKDKLNIGEMRANLKGYCACGVILVDSVDKRNIHLFSNINEGKLM